MYTYLAIIGSNENEKYKIEHLEYIKTKIIEYIQNNIGNTTNIILLAGGSIWCDHVVAQLYLDYKFAGIQLYLPTEFNTKKKYYSKTYEGRVFNILHKEFREKTGIDSLYTLSRVIPDADITIGKGFLKRSILIVKNCDHLILFTFDDICKNDNLILLNKFDSQNKINYNLEH